MSKYSRKKIMVASLVAFVFLLASCAPKVVEKDIEAGSNSEDSFIVEVSWTPESDCTVCHSEYEGTLGETMHQEAACIDCHDVSLLESSHDEVTAPPSGKVSAKKNSVAADSCALCHAKEDLAAATVASTVLTDENGTVCNPHALPDGQSHQASDVAGCVNCHSIHKGENIAAKYCAGCHHENVYECHTCH